MVDTWEKRTNTWKDIKELEIDAITDTAQIVSSTLTEMLNDTPALFQKSRKLNDPCDLHQPTQHNTSNTPHRFQLPERCPQERHVSSGGGGLQRPGTRGGQLAEGGVNARSCSHPHTRAQVGISLNQVSRKIFT